MFSWFKKKSTDSVFGLMDDGRHGSIDSRRQVQAVEDSLVDASPGLQPADRFLGLSITAKRFQIALVVIGCVLVGLTARAAQLQLLEGESYRALAEGNRFRAQTIPAVRGVVYDRNGEVLIENVPAFTLFLVIGDLPRDKGERDRVFERITDLAGLQRADLDLLLQEYADTPFEPVIVKKDLGYGQAMLAIIEEPELAGFHVEILTKRRYRSEAPSLSHVLGYVGKINAEEFDALRDTGYRRTDEIGKTGVEKSAEAALRGLPGRKTVEVDAYGDETTVLSLEEPTPGASVTLAIDLEMQAYIELRLKDTMQQLAKSRASIVVMDPRNGEVLSLVSLPTYDSNVFAGGIDTETYARLSEDPDHPLFPRAISGEFPSGSTFKPFVASAALAEGIIDAHTSFVSVGGLNVGPWFFPDWKAGGHGVTDVRKAIAESVNTFFYIVGGGYNDFIGLGAERITAYAREFGFGSATGIDLPGEADGFLPSKEWKEEVKGERWYVGDTYHLAIGQGDLLATPLQMAVGLSTVANGGTRYAPRIVQSINGVPVEPEGVELEADLRSAITVVQQGMRQTVTSGSARSLSLLPISSAGKTGTAQGGVDRDTHAWYIGYAPYETPEIAIVVLIEEGGEGSSVAVPIARDILNWWYALRYVPSLP